jgi:hypothetical protein
LRPGSATQRKCSQFQTLMLPDHPRRRLDTTANCIRRQGTYAWCPQAVRRDPCRRFRSLVGPIAPTHQVAKRSRPSLQRLGRIPPRLRLASTTVARPRPAGMSPQAEDQWDSRWTPPSLIAQKNARYSTARSELASHQCDHQPPDRRRGHSPHRSRARETPSQYADAGGDARPS